MSFKAKKANEVVDAAEKQSTTNLMHTKEKTSLKE